MAIGDQRQFRRRASKGVNRVTRLTQHEETLLLVLADCTRLASIGSREQVRMSQHTTGVLRTLRGLVTVSVAPRRDPSWKCTHGNTARRVFTANPDAQQETVRTFRPSATPPQRDGHSHEGVDSPLSSGALGRSRQRREDKDDRGAEQHGELGSSVAARSTPITRTYLASNLVAHIAKG